MVRLVGWMSGIMLALAGPIWAAPPESAGNSGITVFWQAGDFWQAGEAPAKGTGGAIFVGASEEGDFLPPQIPQMPGAIPGAGGMVFPSAGFSEPVPKPSEYWLGVVCVPVDPTLRAQLQLPEGQGLVVRSVAPDSPAAKAGLREHDILLKAGQKDLAQIKDLVEAVEEAKEKKLSLEIVREGKRQKIDVTPVKRPEDQAGVGGWFGPPAIPAPGNPDFEAFRKWFEKMQSGQPLRFRFFQPGFVLPPGSSWQGPLPKGLSIAITKTGDEPARISVKKDGQTWEVTEKELDKLPEDIRPHVERLLGKSGIDIDFNWGDTPIPGFGGGFGGGWPKEDRLPGRSRWDFQKQLEKQQQELEKLQKQFEELKKSLEKSLPEAAPKGGKKPGAAHPPKEKV